MRPSAALVLAVVLAAPTWAMADDLHGQVTFVKGTLERQVGPERSPVAVGAGVGGGDHLFTGPDSLAELLFEDGTVVRLAPSSELEVQELEVPPDGPSLKARLKLALGSMWANVIKLRRGGVFEVETTWSVAGVRGTQFRVDSTPAGGAVEVYRGKVQVDARQPSGTALGTSFVLPGNRIAIDASGARPGPAGPRDAFGTWAAERPRPSRSAFTLHEPAGSRDRSRNDRRDDQRELRRDRR